MTYSARVIGLAAAVIGLVTALLGIVPGCSGCIAKEAIILRARNYIRADSRGVLHASETAMKHYGDVLISPPGAPQSVAVYEFDAPCGGVFEMTAEYASGESRSVGISLNGEMIFPSALTKNTGGFLTLASDRVGEVKIKKGINRFEVKGLGSIPHISSLTFTPKEL